MRRTTCIAAGAWCCAVLATGATARASLTTSEAEEIRGYVAVEGHADRVRALVARPDLSADESAGAMTSALSGAAIDERRIAYLEDVVRNAPSTATRPVLAVATVRALLARADAIYAQHPADLDRAAGALGEIGRAYGFVAAEVSGLDTAMNDGARADIGKALVDHIGRNAPVLKLDAKEPLPVAKLRAQVAISVYDAMPDGATRRVDAADKLGLTGPRRTAMVELGILVLDASGSDERIADVRAALDRLPGAKVGTEAVFVGDEQATFRSRAPVVSAGDAVGPLGEAMSPWGGEADPPAVSARTWSLAHGLGVAALARALDKRPGLRVQVDQDGGAPAVANVAAMLAVDPGRTIDVAAARLLAGKRETAAWLADALGALAVFAPAAGAHDGLVVPLGTASATRVVLEPTGAVSAFKLGTHTWRIDRDGSGASAIKRDGAPVTLSTLATARVAATDGASWSGAGLVFARLAGSPKVAIASGPRVRLVGSTVADSIITPAPGDDLTLDADLHLDGAPAGIIVRARPVGTTFQAISVLLLPGDPIHSAVLLAEGSGADTAVAPVDALPAAAMVHVHLVLKGLTLTGTVGTAPVSVTLPAELAHGDIGLRAYPGGTLEVVGWQVGTGKKH